MIPPPIGMITTGGPEAPYWQGVQDGVLRLPQCEGCGRWTWPPQPRCGECASWAFAWTEVDAAGEVYSWTRTWHPVAPEVADSTPYVTVLVSLPHAGSIRLLGFWLDDRDPALGETVAVDWSVDRSPNPYALCWRRA
jgi:uncharacterized protein